MIHLRRFAATALAVAALFLVSGPANAVTVGGTFDVQPTSVGGQQTGTLSQQFFFDLDGAILPSYADSYGITMAINGTPTDVTLQSLQTTPNPFTITAYANASVNGAPATVAVRNCACGYPEEPMNGNAFTINAPFDDVFIMVTLGYQAINLPANADISISYNLTFGLPAGVSVTPLPSSVWLFAAGLGALGFVAHRRQQKAMAY